MPDIIRRRLTLQLSRPLSVRVDLVGKSRPEIQLHEAMRPTHGLRRTQESVGGEMMVWGRDRAPVWALFGPCLDPWVGTGTEGDRPHGEAEAGQGGCCVIYQGYNCPLGQEEATNGVHQMTRRLAELTWIINKTHRMTLSPVQCAWRAKRRLP